MVFGRVFAEILQRFESLQRILYFVQNDERVAWRNGHARSDVQSPANARLLGCKGGDQVREFSESLYGKHGCNQFLGHLFRTKELNPFGIDSFVS